MTMNRSNAIYRRKILFLFFLIFLTVSALSEVCAEEATEPSGDDESGEYSLSFRFLPFLKLGTGVSVYPVFNAAAFFDVDVIIGGRYELIHGHRSLDLVPEIGYTFHYGENVQGHYGALGAGLRYGSVWFAGSSVTTLLLGSRDDEFDLGVRAGIRLETLLGFLGLELTYEFRTLGGEDLHGLRFIFTIDAAVVVMPVTLTRLGWAFGRRR